MGHREDRVPCVAGVGAVEGLCGPNVVGWPPSGLGSLSSTKTFCQLVAPSRTANGLFNTKEAAFGNCEFLGALRQEGLRVWLAKHLSGHSSTTDVKGFTRNVVRGCPGPLGPAQTLGFLETLFAWDFLEAPNQTTSQCVMKSAGWISEDHLS